MSDEISARQAEKFFREVTPVACPFCGSDKWHFLVSPKGDSDLVSGLPITPTPRNPERLELHARECVFIECSKCGFLRAHGAKVIRGWLQSKEENV